MNKDRLAFWTIGLATVYYIVLFSVYSIFLQMIFHTQAFDSGIDDQGIWLLSRFLNPFVTVRGMNLFGDSVTLYHFVFVPFFWLWNNINILYIVQSFFLGIGAIPLFLFAKEKLKDNYLALSVGLSYLLYPALQNLNLDQFHSESITVFFFIMTLYFLLKNNFKLFYVFFVISLLGKDEVALTGVFIGFFLMLFKKEFRHGFIVIGLSVAWYLVCSRIFMPLFNGVGIFDPQPVTYSHWFRGLMDNLLNPQFYWQNIFHAESLRYYFNLLSPLVFIPLAGWQVLFLIIPSVAVNVLSGTGYLRSVFYHYNYIQTAVVFFALIYGLQAIQKKRFFYKDLTVFFSVIVLSCAVFANIFLSHLPINKHWSLLRQKIKHYRVEENQARLKALKFIPKEAKVSASYSLVPHLSHRQEIYMFPNPFRPALWDQWFKENKSAPPAKGHVDYLAIDRGTIGDREGKLWLDYFIDSFGFKVIYDVDQILILQWQPVNLPANSGLVFGQGKLSMLYFPDSNYYFRNLIGEEISLAAIKKLKISGYFFIPEGGAYGVKLKSSGQASCFIDNDKVAASLYLNEGFHKLIVDYVDVSPPYSLRFTLVSPMGKEYIIPDQDWRCQLEPIEFKEYLSQKRLEKAARGKYLASLPNLVLNGDFEKQLDNQPVAWEFRKWEEKAAKNYYGLDKKIKHQGECSVRLEHNQQADSRWLQEVLVKPNTKYVLSAWIKTEGVSNEGRGAYLQIGDGGQKSETISGTNDWQKVELNFQTGPGQNDVLVLCRLGDYGAPNIGIVYFDNVIVKEFTRRNSFNPF